MSLEQTIDNLQIRNANMVTFVGTSNTMVDTTTGRIQTKGIQHNSNVITDVSGPHGRGVATLKKYPDIIFEKEKFEYNNSSNTYSQAGYTVSVSSQDANLTNDERGIVYYMFDGAGAGSSDNQWTSASASNYGAGTFNNTNAHYQIAATDVDGATIPHGEWIKLKMPKKIRLERVFLQPNLSNMNETPEDFKIYGSNDGTTWKLLITQTGMVPRDAGNDIVPATTISGYYDEYAIVITKIYNNAQPDTSIEELEFYGYEEDPPAGDHSVDTTFKSRFNNPQTTGVQVLVDGATGVGTNQISGGPDPSGNQSTYVTDGKYWTLNGTLTSNLAVEANTFLEGDQPHAVSVWFNSSNLEANVSNTCVFSIASEEKLDSLNLDLQSNTWHNVTYAYQGEGGSRVTYLDGRKVSEDQAEDTFGDYPPFAMTGYSQGGYVASASSDIYSHTGFTAWKAFNNVTGNEGWHTGYNYLSTDTSQVQQAFIADAGGAITTTATATNLSNGTNRPAGGAVLNSSAGNIPGEWLKVELPHKIKLSYVKIRNRDLSNSNQCPKDFKILGSNDDDIWYELIVKQNAGYTAGSTHNEPITNTQNGQNAYKYLVFSCTRINSTGDSSLTISEISYYGHRENDLVRLPDPTNVLKYPHIQFPIGPNSNAPIGIRGYVASGSSSSNSGIGRRPWSAFNDLGEGQANLGGLWQNQEDGSNHKYTPQTTGLATTNAALFEGVRGEWIKLELPHKIKVSQVYILTAGAHEGVEKAILYGSNDDTNWDVIKDGGTAGVGFTFTLTANGGLKEATESVTTSNCYKYLLLQVTEVVVGSGSTDGRSLQLYKLQYFGTGVDSIPIQIGGGNIDKVANFRVYDRFIEEDQVNEIWNAQKEEFGRAKPQMVLQQGKLGIGTDAPQGSLSVADEPHNVEEFPPRAMTGEETYMEGHGKFCVSTSNVYDSNYTGYKAFNKNSSAGAGNWWSQSDAGIVPSYSTSSGDFSYFSYNSQYSTNVEGATKMGHWLQIEFPYKINYRYSDIQGPNHAIGRQPRAGYILGSNDLTGVWTSLHNFTNVTRTHKYESVRYTPPTVSTQTFKYFRLVIEKLGGGNAHAGISQWDIFGTREQGQSVIHDGQLTLTKSLNVPRIGPPLDADDTPRRDRLIVEYNTSSNPTFEGAVRDTSGRGLDGIMYTATYNAAEKAIESNGNTGTSNNGPGGSASGNLNDYGSFETVLPSSLQGNPVFTVSGWFKQNTIAHLQLAWLVARNLRVSANPGLSNKMHWLGITSSGRPRIALGGGGNLNLYYTDGSIKAGIWHHMVVVIEPTGTDVTQNHVRFYLDGVLQTTSNTGSSGTIDLGDGAPPRMHWFWQEASDVYYNGSASNLKLHECALTAEEVKTLYDMGRNGSVANPQPLQIAAPLYAPGTIVQVEQSIKRDDSSTTSTAASDIPGLSVTIHPKFGTSKILVSYQVNMGGNYHMFLRVRRTQSGTTTYDVGTGNANGNRPLATGYQSHFSNTNGQQTVESLNMEILDSANGTDPITYHVQFWVANVNYTAWINRSLDNYNNAYGPGCLSSSITVKEVCQ